MNLISTTRAIGEHFIDGKSSYLCRARGSGQTPAYALHFSRHSACKTKSCARTALLAGSSGRTGPHEEWAAQILAPAHTHAC